MRFFSASEIGLFFNNSVVSFWSLPISSGSSLRLLSFNKTYSRFSKDVKLSGKRSILFSESIKENIKFGKINSSIEEIKKAALYASVNIDIENSFIDKMEKNKKKYPSSTYKGNYK